MAKAQARSETKEEGAGRIDTVRPPPDLPDATPFERMTELARRILGVPKNEAIPKKRTRHKR